MSNNHDIDNQKTNGSPCTAFNQPGHPDAEGPSGRVPCPVNNHAYYHNRDAKHTHTFRHPLAHSGYCRLHVRLGCEATECQ